MRWNLSLLFLANVCSVLASVTEMTDKIVKVGFLLVHSCTIFLCCLDGEIYDPYTNPNMNNRDHRVG